MTTKVQSGTAIIKGDGFRHEWGIRRKDGQPWRTEPSAPGASDYYIVGDEVSADAMVMGCMDAVDAVFCSITQSEGTAAVPQPGPVQIVRAVYRGGTSGESGWFYEDIAKDDLVAALGRLSRGAVLAMAEIALRPSVAGVA